MEYKEGIARVYGLRAQIKALNEEIAEILSEIDPPLGTDAVGHYLVNVTETKRFNEGLAKDVLTKAEYARILKPVPQSAIAKTLYPEKFEQMQKVSGKTVRIDIDKEA